ncbi:MAG: alginate export family protein [Acidobacteria bacterium]|nr:alginate export family protein [Acidobacteriota bacterium]
MRGARRTFAVLVVPALLAAVGDAAGVEEAKSGETKKPVQWTFSGEVRFRPEYRDDADLNRDIDDLRRQGFMRMRLGVEAMFRDRYRVFIQPQDARVAGEETSTASNEKNLDLHQGFLEIVTGEGRRLQWRFGRQEWIYGDERLIGAFGWDNVGRAFDGARVRYARGRFWLDGLLGQLSSRATTVTTTPGPAGTPSIISLRTDGGTLYGVYAQSAAREGAQYEGYILGFDDHVDLPSPPGPAAVDEGDTRIHALGGRAQDRFGRFDFTVEAAVETGRNQGDDLSAWAAAAQGGVTIGSAARVRLFAGYDFATGDEVPADGERQEFFNFFPTNHPHYGYADYEGWRNIASPYAGVSVTRGRHFILAKLHDFGLEEARGPWKDAGGNLLGFDPTGASGTGVGREIDLLYRVGLGDRTVLEGGWSRFAPGEFARATRGDENSDWAYVMLTVGF